MLIRLLIALIATAGIGGLVALFGPNIVNGNVDQGGPLVLGGYLFMYGFLMAYLFNKKYRQEMDGPEKPKDAP